MLRRKRLGPQVFEVAVANLAGEVICTVRVDSETQWRYVCQAAELRRNAPSEVVAA